MVSKRLGNHINEKNKKRKNKVLTIKEKLDLLKKLESGTPVRELCETFDVGSSTVYDLKKKKTKLLEFYSSSETKKCMDIRKTMRHGKSEELDKTIMQWIGQNRSGGLKISGEMLMAQAKTFHEELNLEHECHYSAGWLHKFKIRHGLSNNTVCGETKSSEEHGQEFAKMVTRGNKAVENQNKKDNISFGARPRLILPKISQKKLSLSPTQGLMTRDSEGQHCSGSESEGSLRAPESQGSLVVSGKHKKKSGFVNQGLTLVTDSTLPLQNDVDQENGSDCTGLEIFSVTGITEERQDFSHLCSDQDIPVEESNLKTTNDNLPIPKEIKVTNQRDNLQEEFFSTDCNGLTERGTINNQSSGTHTYGKRKRRKSESYKEPEALLGNDEDFVKTCNDQIEADSCDAFGRYIALQLKQLPIENALNLQMVIHKLVAEERLKVQQKEVRMKKRVVKRKGTVDSAFGIHSSVKESSTNEFYADNSTRRGQTWVKYNVVNDKSNDRSNSLKKSSKIEWHNKDSIQVKAPKKSTIFGDMERLPIKKSNEESNIHSSSAEDSLAMTATVMRQPDTFSEDSPGMAAAAEEPPDEVYNFENQSLLNITIDKQGFEDDDDCNYWDAPSPISVKSEAESISSG